MCANFISAQDSSIIYKHGKISKGKVQYYGNNYDCSVIEFDAPPGVVEDAIKEMMSKRGHKSSSKKGFLVYKNVVLRRTELKDPVDVYAQIDSKSRSEKQKTLVSMLITVPGAIPDRRIEKNEAAGIATIGLTGAGSLLLSDMEEDVSLAAHSNDITTQQELISQTEKELNYLAKDSIDLQKRLMKLQQDIAENGKAQSAAKQKLLEETTRLEMMKARKLEKKN